MRYFGTVLCLLVLSSARARLVISALVVNPAQPATTRMSKTTARYAHAPVMTVNFTRTVKYRAIAARLTLAVTALLSVSSIQYLLAI